MEPIIIDNFLEEKHFNALTNLICNTTFENTWSFGQYHHIGKQDKETLITNYFFTHTIYIDGVPMSNHWAAMQHFVEKIQTLKIEYQEGELAKEKGDAPPPPGQWRLRGGKIKAILRIRANLFVNTSTVYEYQLHTDYPFSHTAAILSLNTCDGYTGIKDEDGIIQKYNSVANRVVFFDAGEDHCSTTTTNAKARFNLIVNYL